MMASKARLFGDDSALSAILVTDDPREQKCLGRQIRHFDHESWQQECENIVLQGSLAKFSQNNEMCLALMHTGQRRLAEASTPPRHQADTQRISVGVYIGCKPTYHSEGSVLDWTSSISNASLRKGPWPTWKCSGHGLVLPLPNSSAAC